MKRNLFKSLCLSGLAAAAVLAVSCEPEGPDPGESDSHGNRFIVTETITPLRYTDMKYNAGAEGVSIEVTDKVTDNFTFVLKPGEEVQSYRLQVYPVSSLYNTLINVLNEEKAQSYTVDKVEELIANMISNTESEISGGILITKDAMGDEYYNLELDWMNSTYAKIDIKPKSDYVIVVQAYFDDKGTELPADLCICHVGTPSEPVVGDPRVALDVQVGYSAYSITHKPNADAYGYYYLSTTSEQIDQFIDAYTEDMYMQLLRHYGALVLTDGGNHVVNAPDQIHGIEYCATAIAIDRNNTPSETLDRYDFTLKDIPENTKKAEGEVKLPHKIAATICQFEVYLSPSAYRLAYNVYQAAEADRIMAMEEAERKLIAENMVRGMGTEQYPGWIVVNNNYGLDYDNDVLTGSDFTSQGWQHELAGDTEYKIIYSLMNGYGQATDLFCTESFKTKTWVKDNPDACQSDVTMEVTSSSRTAFYIDAVFSSDNTARIWWQYYYPDNPGAGYDLPDPEEIIKADESRKDEFDRWDPAGDDARYGTGKYGEKDNWMYWFHVWRDPSYGFPWPNEICDAYASGQIKDQSFFDGFTPDTKVYFAYMAEDWNGVLGPVKFFDGTTKRIVPGNNPEVISLEHKDLGDGNFEIIFECNEDAHTMMYAARDQFDSDAYMLKLDELAEEDFGGISYEDYIKNWTNYVKGTGLKTQSLNGRVDMKVKGDIAVAIVLPIGGAVAGQDVYGDIKTLVYTRKDGKFQSLEEYMGVAAE